jgi:hypothetical protein
VGREERGLLQGPGIKPFPGLFHVRFRYFTIGHVHRQFHAEAVGVEEIDGTHETVVGDTEHLDTGVLQAALVTLQHLQRLDLHGEVVDPRRRVG